MKKFFALMLICSMGLVTVGCGDTATKKDETKKTTETKTTDTHTATPPANPAPAK